MKYGLNDEQWRAVTAPSPTMVNASAGSGKTRCLVAKVRHLMDNGVPARGILAITFTNKAANEMKERLKQHHDITGMQVSTIHSMCVRIIKEYSQYTPLKTPFTIYDTDDQLSVIKTILKARDYPENPRDIQTDISRAKADQAVYLLEGNTLKVYRQYQEILVKNNACDFDDLLLYAHECLGNDPCRIRFQRLWDHILVDEVQDTSQIQYDIILRIFNPKTTKTLFMVGDENQSIYGFRSARPENIQDFIERFNPTICNLTYNYRSCAQIIDHANEFLQYGNSMVSKAGEGGQVSLTMFSSNEDEAAKIADALLKMKGYEKTAILYRVNARSLEFEKAFSRYRIPYKVVGDLPFFRRRVVKDLMAMLKAANNKADIESLARVINTPKRGFGEAKKEKLLLEGREYADMVAAEMPEVKSFLSLLDRVAGKKPFEALQDLLFGTHYKQFLKKDSDKFMVDALLNVTSEYETAEDLILASSFLEQDSGRGVQLMTAHASKGLEFDRVFLVGLEEDVWPHKLSTDPMEEARLFYVACTRAKKYLNISCSRSKRVRNATVETYASSLFRKTYKKLFGKDMGS